MPPTAVPRALIASMLLLGACTPKEPVELGASCSSNQDACAVGKLAMCVGGKWQETLSCVGPTACQRKTMGHGSTAAICDQGIAHVGNVCSDVMQLACGEDWKSQVVCRGGRWALQKSCPNGCSYPKNQVTCL